MKFLNILFFHIILLQTISAQDWQPCNLNLNNNGTSGTSLCIHNGKLFASNNKGIHVSSNYGQTFTQVNSDLTNGFKMLSTGSRLYLITGSAGCSDIWYSTDEGVSFKQDTLGLPNCGVPRRPSASGKAWKDRLILTLAGPDWEWTKHVNDASWTDASYFDANDCSEFFVKNDTCWAATNGATSNGLAWSVDGVNWTSPACANITQYYVPAQMAWVDNRVIFSGSDVGSFTKPEVDTVLKYSDDYGATFSSINIKQYLNKYAFYSPSGKQVILDMYSAYGKLYLALGQNVLGSAPDLLVSNDKGMTFEKDSFGFPDNIPNSLFEITDMAFIDGWAFAQINSGDVYRKKISTVGNVNSIGKLNQVIAYPSIDQNQLNITQSENLNSQLIISNLIGQVMIEKRFFSNGITIDISTLPKGQYLLNIQNEKGIHNTSFVK